MRRIFVNVQKDFCADCALALRRFIGGMEGVSAIDVENGRIVIDFDEKKFPEKDLRALTRESIEKLGYRVNNDG